MASSRYTAVELPQPSSWWNVWCAWVPLASVAGAVGEAIHTVRLTLSAFKLEVPPASTRASKHGEVLRPPPKVFALTIFSLKYRGGTCLTPRSLLPPIP